MYYLLKDGTIVEGTITKDKLMIKVKDRSFYIEVEQIAKPLEVKDNEKFD